jgi:hypothetical protein
LQAINNHIIDNRCVLTLKTLATLHSANQYRPKLVLPIFPFICKHDSFHSFFQAIDDRTIGHNPERASLLKGGIVYSNVVTTVSPTYSEETLCSGWLSSALMRNRGKYHGVLNGIDTVLWDPERDPHLPATFSGKFSCPLFALFVELLLFPVFDACVALALLELFRLWSSGRVTLISSAELHVVLFPKAIFLSARDANLSASFAL